MSMSTRRVLGLMLGLAVALAIGVLSARDNPEPVPKQPADPRPAADEQAIRAASREFAAAFNKGDAKAVAALWTDQGECHDTGGEMTRGRAAIEQAFAEHFRDSPR